MYCRDGSCNYLDAPDGSPAIRLCATWWDAQDTVTGDTLEELLRGMASQIAEQEDATLCADIRNKLFGPLDFSRRDLAALNIMRGRDSGLPDYNTVRSTTACRGSTTGLTSTPRCTAGTGSCSKSWRRCTATTAWPTSTSTSAACWSPATGQA